MMVDTALSKFNKFLKFKNTFIMSECFLFCLQAAVMEKLQAAKICYKQTKKE